jgi:hypothetical protein
MGYAEPEGEYANQSGGCSVGLSPIPRLTTQWSGRPTAQALWWCVTQCLWAAAHRGRVCRAWHSTDEVPVLVPGVRGAEGEEQGKGVTARWGLEAAQSKEAGRRTGTGYKVWYTRDEWARAHKVLHPQGGYALSIRRLRLERAVSYPGRPPRGLGRWRATAMGGGRREHPCPPGRSQ